MGFADCVSDGIVYSIVYAYIHEYVCMSVCAFVCVCMHVCLSGMCKYVSISKPHSSMSQALLVVCLRVSWQYILRPHSSMSQGVKAPLSKCLLVSMS
jgi:hypothetical protein